MDISLQLSMILWISIWISSGLYGYPCIDLLWILDPGFENHFCQFVNRKEIARNRATIIEINQFLDFHREIFDDLLASRPDDLAVFMEDQLEDAKKRTSEEILKAAEDGSSGSPEHPSLYSVPGIPGKASSVIRIPGKTSPDGREVPSAESGKDEPPEGKPSPLTEGIVLAPGEKGSANEEDRQKQD